MSFQLLRTNPLLTTNFKINIDSGMSLYIESIKTNSVLKSHKYDRFSINKDSFLEDQLPLFYDGLSKEHAFQVRNESDNDFIYNDYKNQFDDIYYSGADFISDKSYDEEFEYFAPLYIKKNNLPDGFIILRVDDPTVYDTEDGIYEIGSLNKNNFRSEIIEKWKSIAYYDMSRNSDFGYWLDRNINQNERFPIHSFELDTRKITFSRWYGMDYKTGVYAQKPMFLDKILEFDQPHFRLEKLITNGFKDNSLIYPHILNFSFLFDDTPATPERLKKYTSNRYYGFYVDELQFVTKLTSYVTPELLSGTTLFNNIIITGNTGLTWDICEKEYDNMIPSVNPFAYGEWNDDENYYIYVKDDLYRVERFRDPETNVWLYKLISDEILDDYWNTGTTYDKTVEIKYDGDESYSYLSPSAKYTKMISSDGENLTLDDGVFYLSVDDVVYFNKSFGIIDKTEPYYVESITGNDITISSTKDGTVLSGINSGATTDINIITYSFIIDEYIDCISGVTEDMYNDVYLIKINDRFHILKNIKLGSTLLNDEPYYNKEMFTKYGYKYFIQSDWGINSNELKLEYWIGGNNSEYYNEYNIENINRKPLVYSIFKIKFSNIKDFDFDRVNTKYSNFDYEKTKYYDTNEEKLYLKDYKSDTYPREEKRYGLGSENQGKIISLSSEYIASEELYETKESGDISDMWVKNQSICKWGFQGSISQSDYPYKMNNSKKVGNYYNRDVDVFSTTPKEYNKNLDYFYRVGNFVTEIAPPKPVYYLNQTTNIQTEFLSQETDEGSLNGGKNFNIATYFEVNVPENYDFDYFEYFFSNHMYIENNNRIYKDRYKKYSIFYGNEDVSPLTLFKGLKIKLNEVLDIKRGSSGKINKILSHNTGKYDNYKFSIILNDCYWYYKMPYNYVDVNGLNNYEGIINVTDNGIHIIVNDIYKNILVIINTVVENEEPIGYTFNNLDYFNEKGGLYHGEGIDGTKKFKDYSPKILTAFNFMNAINDMNEKHGFDNHINFYHIYKNENGKTEYKKSGINGTNYPITPPVVLSIISPDTLSVKRDSYKIELIDGPSTNPLYRKSTYEQRINKRDEYLSNKLVKNYDNEKYDKIFRYSGPYEPIFNEINLFNEGIFCIIDHGFLISGVTETVEKNAENGKNSTKTISKSRGIDPGLDELSNVWKKWKNINSICSENNNDLYTYISASEITDETDTDFLVLNGFDFNLPMSYTTINGITVDIERKSHNNTSSSYVKDSEIRLTRNYNDLSSYSENKAISGNWETGFTNIIYGSDTDLWINGDSTITEWKPRNINSSNFGVMIKTTIKNDMGGSKDTSKLMADIKCVKVKVHYEYEYSYISGHTFYVDRNSKFDESVYNFGKINEIIYSKVNIDNKNILKFNNAKYPIVDQFGYGYASRFIFKSDWDREFYYNTIESFEDDSTDYVVPKPSSINTDFSTQTLNNDQADF